MSSFSWGGLCYWFNGRNVNRYKEFGEKQPLTSQRYHLPHLYERWTSFKGMKSAIVIPNFQPLSRVCQFTTHSRKKHATWEITESLQNEWVCRDTCFCCWRKVSPKQLKFQCRKFLSCYLGVGDRLWVTEQGTSCPCLWLMGARVTWHARRVSSASSRHHFRNRRWKVSASAGDGYVRHHLPSLPDLRLRGCGQMRFYAVCKIPRSVAQQLLFARKNKYREAFYSICSFTAREYCRLV